MTRDEAIKLIDEKFRKAGSSQWSGAWIDAFETLGMLKLDKPKSAAQKFQEAFGRYAYSETIFRHIQEALESANAKIVDKD